MKHSTPTRSARPGYSRTPILSAVKRQHAEDDKADASRGRDPYNTLSRRDIATVPASAKHEATQILACYETHLTIEE